MNTRIGDTRSTKSKLNEIFDTTIRSRQFVIVQNYPGQSVIVKIVKKEKSKKASFVKNVQANFAIFMVIAICPFFFFFFFFFLFLPKRRHRFSKRNRRGEGLVRGTFKFSMINVFTLSLIRANFLSFHV